MYARRQSLPHSGALGFLLACLLAQAIAVYNGVLDKHMDHGEQLRGIVC